MSKILDVNGAPVPSKADEEISEQQQQNSTVIDVTEIINMLSHTANVCNVNTVGLISVVSLLADILDDSFAQKFGERAQTVTDILGTEEGANATLPTLIEMARGKKDSE